MIGRSVRSRAYLALLLASVAALAWPRPVGAFTVYSAQKVNSYCSGSYTWHGDLPYDNAYDTQYYQTIGGTTTHITYSESVGGTWADTTNPSTSGCNSTAGGSVASGAGSSP